MSMELRSLARGRGDHQEGLTTEGSIESVRAEEFDVARDRFVKNLLYQAEQRYEILPDTDPQYTMLRGMHENLAQFLTIPKGETIVINEPAINMFVVRGEPNVYSQMGMVRAYVRWCQQTGRKATEDGIAWIVAHELTHIDQGTHEVDETNKGRRESNQESLNAEYDADRGGITLMARAGYNPREGLAAVQFFHALKEVDVASTHPREADRVRELVDLVESPDTFLPNVDKQPRVIGEPLLSLLLQEPSARMGTELYRAAAPQQLEQLAERAERIYDAIELANMAATHDRIAVIEQLMDRPELHTARAQGIFLHNVTQIIKALSRAHPENDPYFGSRRRDGGAFSNGASEWQDVGENIKYLKTEFVDSDVIPPANVSEPVSSDVLTKSLERKIKETHKLIRECIGLCERADVRYASYIADGASRTAKLVEEQVRGKVILEKLRTIEAQLDGKLSEITPDTLERYVVDGQVIEKPTGPWHETDETYEYVTTHEADALLQLCAETGNIYFHDWMRSRSKENNAHSGNAFNIETKYVPYLDKSYFETLDLSQETGRRTLVERQLFNEAEEHARMFFYGNLETTMEALMTGEPFSEVAPKESYTAHIDKVRAPLIERFKDTYLHNRSGEEILTAASAQRVAEFVVDHTYRINDVGLTPTVLVDLVDTLSIEECQRWVERSPEPSVKVGTSADQMFSAETQLHNVFIELDMLVGGWEYRMTRAVQARLRTEGQTRQTSTQRLEQINRVLELSSRQSVSLYYSEIIELLSDVTIQTHDDLERYVSPFVRLFDYDQEKILTEVIKRYSDTVPPADMFSFLEGQSYGIQFEYITYIWENRFATFQPDQQFQFLDLVYTHIPYYPDNGLIPQSFAERNKHYDETYDSVEYTKRKTAGIREHNKIAAQYIRLYREVSGNTSIVEPLKRLMKDGYMTLDPETGELVGDAELHAAYLNLTQPELEAIAEYYCAEVEPNKTKLPAHPLTQNEPLYADILNSIARRCLEGRGISESKVDITDKSIDEAMAFVVKHAPKSVSDFYMTDGGSGVKIKFGDDYVARDTMLKAVFSAYGLTTQQVVERGYALQMVSIPESAYAKHGIPDLSRGAEDNAERYLASATSILEGVKRERLMYQRRLLLEEYFETDTLSKDASRPPRERAAHVLEVLPERTTYRDELLQSIESTALEHWNVTVEGHQIHFPTTIDQIDTHAMYQFYAEYHVAIVDVSIKQLWARRADYIFNEHATAERTFDSEITRLVGLYPDPSYVRDEALFALGDSNLVRTPENAKQVVELLFVAQRRTKKTEVMETQSQLEWANQIFSVLDRGPKKDFLLWTLGVEKNPPLHVKAVGGYYGRSMEELPKVIFGATQQERQEFLIRMLYGDNGVLDPRTQDDEPIFEELLERTFNEAFPEAAGGLEGKAREVVHTIFTTVLHEYEPYRRSQIFISVIEVLKVETNASTGRRLRRLLEALGPVAIKAGQVLSEEKSDDGGPLLPGDIQSEMAKLKQNVKTFRRTTSIQVLESAGQFGNEPHQIVSLDERLSAASIKQVNRVTRGDRKRAVTKVRRPSILKHLDEDLRVFSKVVDNLSTLTNVPEGLADRVGRWLRAESDFEEEVRNHEAIREIMEEYNSFPMRAVHTMEIVVAEIYSHSAEHITEEEIRGLSLDELTQVAAGRAQLGDFKDKYQLTDREIDDYAAMLPNVEQYRIQAFDALLYQYFVKGRFTADPHGGNLVVTPDAKLGFIDLGSTGEIAPAELNELRKFFVGFLFFDSAQVTEAIQKFVPAIARAQLSVVEGIITSPASNKDKFSKILVAISEGGTSIDEGFEKFLKSLATGAYLTEGVDPMALAPSVLMYAQVN